MSIKFFVQLLLLCETYVHTNFSSLKWIDKAGNRSKTRLYVFVLMQITREVELHRHLRHKNVVCFYSYFEDENYVYMILENCSRKVINQSLSNEIRGSQSRI